MSATCPRCGRSWSGSKPEHCPACCETFAGTVAGDRHRVGDHTGVIRIHLDGWERGRRCLTPTEMLKAGLSPNVAGHWSVTAARERASRYRRDPV